MKILNSKTARALTMGALLFLVPPAVSKNKNPEKSEQKTKVKTETHQDLIEKAQALSLQGARFQAIMILISAISKETKKPLVVKELISSLDQIARVFVSERAQQAYELGLSLKNSDPNTAQGKFAEANKLEPDNLEIDMASARIFLMQGDCDKALNKLERWKEALPYIDELKVLQAQSSLCRGEFKEYLVLKPTDNKKSTAWLMLATEHAYRTGQFNKAIEIAEQLAKSQPAFPESQYWIFKSKLELKQNAENSGQKYLSQCKSISGRALRDYMFEPMLCKRTLETEAALKKISGGAR